MPSCLNKPWETVHIDGSSDSLIVKCAFVKELVDGVIIITSITNTTVLGFIQEYRRPHSSVCPIFFDLSIEFP